MKALTSIIAASILLLSPIFAHHEREEPPEGAVARTVLPDVKMPIMNEHSRSTLVCAMYALLPALGQQGWSIPRLEALTGYAFYFQMREGGESVFDDDLDWGLAMHVLDIFGQAKVYDADKNSDVDLPALKAEARDAVVASLENGLPSLVWAPLSLEQRGKVHFACWGLIVGYNAADGTYLIRQPAEKLDYPVRFDAIGFADPSDWFRVDTFKPKDLDDNALHLTSLRNAVAFANGTRYDNPQVVEAALGHPPKNPYGFAAYELWQEAFESDVNLNATFFHTETLKPRREAAAAYLRELTYVYPAAANPLEAAAVHYDREVESITAIFDLCVAATKHEPKAFTPDQRAEIRPLIAQALKADRAAVAQIEAALKILETP